jgi:hypothetical protein
VKRPPTSARITRIRDLLQTVSRTAGISSRRYNVTQEVSNILQLSLGLFEWQKEPKPVYFVPHVELGTGH